MAFIIGSDVSSSPTRSSKKPVVTDRVDVVPGLAQRQIVEKVPLAAEEVDEFVLFAAGYGQGANIVLVALASVHHG